MYASERGVAEYWNLSGLGFPQVVVSAASLCDMHVSTSEILISPINKPLHIRERLHLKKMDPPAKGIAPREVAAI